MSFLVEDDPHATLELALAFIDACDDTSSSDTDVLPTVSFSVDHSSTQSTVPAQALKQQQRSKKARSNANAVTRHRERKKAETIALRNELVELETKLTQLQENARFKGASALQYLLEQQQLQNLALSAESGTAKGNGKSGQTVIRPKQVSIWLDIAAMQARERYQAENLNMKLKDALEKQVKVARALEGILGKKMSLYGLDLLLDEQKQALYNDSVITQQSMVYEDLRVGMQEMYITADFLFDPQTWSAAFDSVSSSTQVKQDPLTGSSYLEICTTTPLRCSFQEAGDIMWKQITQQSSDSSKGKYCMQKRFLTDTSFQKSYTMVIDGPDGPVEMRGASHVERFVEANRVISMWYSRVLLPNDGPRFIEKGWMVTSSPTSLMDNGVNMCEQQQPTTVFRTCYQVSCDSKGGERSAQDPRTSNLIETVLRTLGSRTRDHQQRTQNTLSDYFAMLPIQRATRTLQGGGCC